MCSRDHYGSRRLVIQTPMKEVAENLANEALAECPLGVARTERKRFRASTYSYLLDQLAAEKAKEKNI